jgi:hypothetical protein
MAIRVARAGCSGSARRRTEHLEESPLLSHPIQMTGAKGKEWPAVCYREEVYKEDVRCRRA